MFNYTLPSWFPVPLAVQWQNQESKTSSENRCPGPRVVFAFRCEKTFSTEKRHSRTVFCDPDCAESINIFHLHALLFFKKLEWS